MNYHTAIKLFLGFALFMMGCFSVTSAAKVAAIDPSEKASFPDSAFIQNNILQKTQDIVYKYGPIIQNLFFWITIYSILVCIVFLITVHFRDKAKKKTNATGTIISERKKKAVLKKHIITCLIIIPFVIFGLMCLINPYQKYGLLNLECYGLSLSFAVFINETKRLNKADSYNIMILILTLISLAIGIYSIRA